MCRNTCNSYYLTPASIHVSTIIRCKDRQIGGHAIQARNGWNERREYYGSGGNYKRFLKRQETKGKKEERLVKRVTSCDPPRDTCSYPDREWAMNLRSYAKTKRSSRTKGSSSTPKGVVTEEKKKRKERRRMEKVKERRRTRTEGPVLGEFLERFVRTFVELARCLRGIRIRRSPDRCTGRRLSSDPR